MTPNSWVPQAAPVAPKPNRTPLVLTLVGVAVLLFCIVPGGCVAYFGSLPESGVRAGNQVPPESRAHIEAHLTLEPGEELVSYFDSTVSMDGTEASLLTNKRVATWKEKAVTQMRVSEVKRIDHAVAGLEGDLIDLTGEDGKTLHLEIAPLNDGDRFVAALERTTGVKVTEREKPE